MRKYQSTMFSSQPLICDVTLPPGERSLYYQILSHEYDELKRACKAYACSRGIKFNDDIFQDTIINCINACCVMTNKQEIYKYFCKSYFMNFIRESKYAYKTREVSLFAHKSHSNERSPEECIVTKDNDFEAIIESDFDSFRKEVYEYVKNDKGERIANIIHDYVDGYSYEELVAKYDIKNIYKKTMPLKRYMKHLIEHWGDL